MSDQKHGISWTDQTWNPIVGCSKVSAGRLLDGQEWLEFPEDKA